MIKVENLKKVYKTNKKKPFLALDDINLTLPETGMVFILGKSGSGKSTFLNLLGGLDTFDGGNITVYGNSLKKFKNRHFDAYRSDFIGFIFQDYHLLEELTVADNIALFDRKKKNKAEVEEALRTVGLEGHGERYPSELSGGQKQRVAVARAIYKNSRIILCDEPTGNLDRKTSFQILDLLKELSKEKLVVIVSHNLEETRIYADRIIELAEGKVISDRTRKKDYVDELVIENGKAIIPYREKMSEEDLEALNRALRRWQVRKIEVNSSGFSDTKLPYKENKIKPKLRKLTKERARKLFNRFLLSKKKQSIVAILTALIAFGAFSVIQAFGRFDAMNALGKSGEGGVTVIEKDTDSYPLGILDDFSFVQADNTYKLYNQTIWQKNSYGNSWDKGKRMMDERNFSHLYIHENYGLFSCDREYLTNLYGKQGEIQLLAGSLDGAEESTGVYITDYFADSILYHEVYNKTLRYMTYESLIGIFNPMGENTACRIAGIIDTDYKTKYQKIVELFDEYGGTKEGRESLKKTLGEDPVYVEFMDEVLFHLGVGYTLNPNYINDFSLEETSLVRTKGLYLSANGVEICADDAYYARRNPTPVPASAYADDEIAIPLKYYNALFGTNYEQSHCNKLNTIEKQKITVKRYENDDDSKRLLYEKEFTVTVLSTSRFSMSENTMLYFQKADWNPSRLYFENVKNTDELITFMEENGYHFVSVQQQKIHRLNDLVSTFYDLFSFLQVLIICMLAVYLVNFGVRGVKQNSYQIGVIKALGGRSRAVESIFVLKTFVVGAIIAVLSVLGSVFFIKVANSILLASVEQVVGMRFAGLEIIAVIPSLLFVDGIFMLGIAVISSLIPALILRKIKPIQIIKAKE